MLAFVGPKRPRAANASDAAACMYDAEFADVVAVAGVVPSAQLGSRLFFEDR